MISSGNPSISREDIMSIVSEVDIIGYYLNIRNIPCTIQSPLRNDNRPSFYLYSPDGSNVNFIDMATGDKGNTITLLCKLWHCNRYRVYEKIKDDIVKFKHNTGISIRQKKEIRVSKTGDIVLNSKIRNWEDYDIIYWNSYGVPIKWLKYYNVYPISHKIITKNGVTSVFRADKYAYVFIEKKEGRISQKFYQPFNKNGYKWQSGMDRSVISLWSKLPERGDKVVICSSLKDSLCFMCNMRIPCICPQGEGYPISDTAMKELKRRFNHIYVLYDNDSPGKKDAKIICDKHNLINIEIPQFDGGKDTSDYYKVFGKQKFKETFHQLIIDATADFYSDLPF